MIISKKAITLFLFESIMLAGIFDLIYIISKSLNPYTTIEIFFIGVGIAAGQRLFQYILPH